MKFELSYDKDSGHSVCAVSTYGRGVTEQPFKQNKSFYTGCDTTVTCHMLSDLEQRALLDDDKISGYSSVKESSEGNDYMKLMLPDTQKLVPVMILQYVMTKEMRMGGALIIS
jgi:hypothetical protein